ncbi:putative methionine/alanine importer small subunit [Corynebacterium sp. 13CS0277]|uniref:methionine/alanine import family NSS transporter small subunit n=1 Tax=Corynebacterium sp. 13CS0277 TaxID=2071994 RepID=UPI000D03453A|nr:methionine/alanine import family NSS transporter small subunit [Corynebacterium sp. 13CS0277]PRQ12098.1 putative methionine/alanine importer small subunit [Corynebacterium sp. 13CS0277]
MTTAAIIMMTVYLAVVWGLLAVASRHLATTNDDECGTLGATDIDEMPMYTA